MARIADAQGYTLLHMVTLVNFQEAPNARATRAVLQAGADPNSRRILGDAPLYFAVGIRWPVLWRHPERLRTPTVTLAMVRALLKSGADPNLRILSQKPFHGRPTSVMKALRNVDLGGERVVRREQFTLLMVAVRLDEDPDIVRTLLEGGADPNLTSKNEGWTALHMAAYKASPAVIQLLLEHGANPHAVTRERQWTALHALAWRGRNRRATKSGQVLLDAGIDPTLKDHRGRTAWDIVRKRFGPADVAAASFETRAVLARLEEAAGS